MKRKLIDKYNTYMTDISKQKCPNCGKSHYQQGMSYSTFMYYPPIWKDGDNINPDRNSTTTELSCLECGHK